MIIALILRKNRLQYHELTRRRVSFCLIGSVGASDSVSSPQVPSPSGTIPRAVIGSFNAVYMFTQCFDAGESPNEDLF